MPAVNKKKILFVAMQNSTHTVRWINQISRSDYEIHLFPTIHAPIHPDLRDVVIHLPWLRMGNVTIRDWVIWLRDWIAVKLKSKLGITSGCLLADPLHWRRRDASITIKNPLPLSFLTNLFGVSQKSSQEVANIKVSPAEELSSYVLSRVIRKIAPDLIHSLEFQNCGYIVLGAREIIGRHLFPTWLVTNWGSDIVYFQQFSDERQTLRRLLEAADYYSCECFRDVSLAMRLGFNGVTLPVIPNAGGVDLQLASELRNKNKPSDRRIILIKGYQNLFGRALVGLESIKKCENELRGYQVVVYSASPETCEYVEELKKTTKINFTISGQKCHLEMLHLFSKARIYIGVSLSDGISTSMLEAMAMGAFPIQTNTSCCEEWISDGITGFSIPPDNVELIADRIRQAITDDSLISRAYEMNWNTISLRLDKDVIKSKAAGYYKTIFDTQEKNRVRPSQ
jgi:glycosyltransferase involved in cell wall biosynthesis